MKVIVLIYFVLLSKNPHHCHPVGPPEDEGLVNEFQYYYDIFINETTIALPSFKDITGIQYLSISGNLQLSERELTAFFDKITVFTYGIRVRNTNLKTLDFLKPFIVHADDDGLNSSIIISDNKELTKIGIDFEGCSWCEPSIIITNNPKLDLEEECGSIISRYGPQRTITNNLVDCGCTIEGKFNKWVQTMDPSCHWLFGNVIVDATSDLEILQTKMANVTKITGGLTIANTTLTDLSLFSSLERVENNANKAEVQTSLFITGNQKLTSLKILFVRDGLYLTILDNPKLCVLAQELEALFGGTSLGANLNINVCFDENSPKHWCKIPESGNYKNLSDVCTIIVGNVVINQETFEYDNLYHLYEITKIYGSLSIIGTPARNFFMFPLLKDITSISSEISPLNISNNTNLISMFENYFNKIESANAAIIQNNQNLRAIDYQCAMFITEKNPDVTNNLQDCKYNDLTPNVEKSNLNVDIFRGIPKYSEVSHSDGSSNEGTQNLPGNSNSTDEETDEAVTTTSPDNSVYIEQMRIECIFFVVLIVFYH